MQHALFHTGTPGMPESIVRPPRIPGLRYRTGALSPAEQAALVAQIDAEDWQMRWSRAVQLYGRQYNYSANSAPLPTAGPFPGWLHELGIHLVRRGFLPCQPNQAVINDYPPGQGIAPHRDYESPHMTYVASISLLSAVTMDFLPLQPAPRQHLYLEPGSVLLLQNAALLAWKHGIARRQSDLVKGQRIPRRRRIGLTLRHVQVST